LQERRQKVQKPPIQHEFLQPYWLKLISRKDYHKSLVRKQGS